MSKRLKRIIWMFFDRIRDRGSENGKWVLWNFSELPLVDEFEQKRARSYHKVDEHVKTRKVAILTTISVAAKVVEQSIIIDSGLDPKVEGQKRVSWNFSQLYNALIVCVISWMCWENKHKPFVLYNTCHRQDGTGCALTIWRTWWKWRYLRIKW